MRSATGESGSEKSMATATGRLEKYLDAYGELIALRQERDPVWLRQLREDGWARFAAKGFPTTHDEDWRFTSLAAVKTPFRRAARGEVALSAREIEKFRVAGAACAPESEVELLASRDLQRGRASRRT